MIRDGIVRLTPEGKGRLHNELTQLVEVKRPELTRRIQDANEHGDISDNSEYEELKEELVLTDARIAELEYLLDRAELIDPPQPDIVDLGSQVTILFDDGETETWRLVSPEEADTRYGAISTESPVGQALLGLKVGQQAEVTTPTGTTIYKVVGVA
jgi:transcription elongation factor GreA